MTFNFAPNPDLPTLNEDWCFVPISLQLQIAVKGLPFILAIKMIMDDFAVCCCFHYIVARIEMSFIIMTSECVLSHYY